MKAPTVSKAAPTILAAVDRDREVRHVISPVRSGVLPLRLVPIPQFPARVPRDRAERPAEKEKRRTNPTDILALTTSLFRKHVNPFGKYHFDLERMRQAEGGREEGIA
jgi:hypothetical protein